MTSSVVCAIVVRAAFRIGSCFTARYASVRRFVLTLLGTSSPEALRNKRGLHPRLQHHRGRLWADRHPGRPVLPGRRELRQRGESHWLGSWRTKSAISLIN
jgi:hypothetical protein